jgi:hypothetical protein
MAHQDCIHSNKRTAHNFVLGTINEMISEGFLIRKAVGSKTAYMKKKSALMSDSKYQTSDDRKFLRQKLSQLEAELAITISEVEFYNELANDRPSLKELNVLKDCFVDARHRSSSLTGKVNACDKLLKMI